MQWLKLAVSGSNVEFNDGYFSGTVTASIFSGSHQGNGVGLTGIVSASYALSASWAPGGQSVTASYALTASYLDNANLYYIHTQSVADVLWTVTHNLGTDYTNVTVWSGSQVVIPASISTLGNNSISVSFPTSESGYVVVSRGTFTQTTIVSASYAITSSYYQESKTFGLTIDGDGTYFGTTADRKRAAEKRGQNQSTTNVSCVRRLPWNASKVADVSEFLSALSSLQHLDLH
jgi:hypothetical protein